MDFLIDSDVFIDYLYLDPDATAFVEGLVPAGIAISIITYLESYEETFLEPNPEACQAPLDHHPNRIRHLQSHRYVLHSLGSR